MKIYINNHRCSQVQTIWNVDNWVHIDHRSPFWNITVHSKIAQ